MSNLSCAVPNGSLWQRLSMYAAIAGYPLREPGRTGFCGAINGVEFFQVDRRMVPRFVARAFDAGVTGYDLLLESGVQGLRSVAELPFSRASDQPTRWVLARRKQFRRAPGQPVRIACELPRLAKLLLRRANLPWSYRIVRIDGSEELCVRFRLADMVLVVTESGTSIRENGLQIVPGCENLLTSTPCLIARNRLSRAKEESLQALACALKGVVGASALAMLTFDIPASVQLETLRLPSSVAPTVAPLLDGQWNACETCIPRGAFGRLSARLKQVGARAISLQRIEGYVP